MGKLKEGTADTCRRCGRPIEWATPPQELDENGEPLLRVQYWMRDPFWVDIDPPGQDIWNSYCNFEEKVGVHVPSNYCPSDTSSGQCWAKVKDPVVTSDGTKLIVCGKHAHKELANYERDLASKERMKMDEWKLDSINDLMYELRKRNIRTMAVNQVPNYGSYQTDYRAVDVLALMEVVWNFEVKIKILEEELERVRNDYSKALEKSSLDDVSV